MKQDKSMSFIVLVVHVLKSFKKLHCTLFTSISQRFKSKAEAFFLKHFSLISAKFPESSSFCVVTWLKKKKKKKHASQPSQEVNSRSPASFHPWFVFAS